MEKVIHWELCKKFISDHTNKWYLHNPKSIPENETADRRVKLKEGEKRDKYVKLVRELKNMKHESYGETNSN